MVEDARAAYRQIGDHDGQQDNARQRQHAHDDRVARGAQQELVDGLAVVCQRIALLEHAVDGVAEGNVDDVQLRQRGDCHDAIAENVHQHAAQPLGIFFLNGMQRVHGEAEFLGRKFLDQENDCRQQHRNDTDGRSKVVVRAGLTEELVVDLHGEGAVALAHHERRAEVGKGAHEHQQRRSQHRRHGQPQHNLEKALDALAAEVCRGFHEAVVQIAEHAVHVDQHERIELCGLHEQDSPEAVDAADVDAQQLQEVRDDARAAEQQNPRVSADEGRRHAAQNTRHEQELCALEAEERIEIGKNDADDERNDRDADGHLEAVQDRSVIILFAEELDKILHGELAALVDERLPQQRADGIDKEQQEAGQQENGDHRPDLKFTPLSHFAASVTLSSWTPLSRFSLPSSVKTLILSVLIFRETMLPLGMMESMEDS